MIIALAFILAVVSVKVLDTAVTFCGGLYLAHQRKSFERWLERGAEV